MNFSSITSALTRVAPMALDMKQQRNRRVQ
jgi:hypothetical protein